MSSQELAKLEPQTAFTMTPRTFEEALKFAELMSDSDLVPSGYKGKPGNILVAIQKGMEVGLSPMAALETIAVINGRASLWGDGMLALVQAHPAYEAIDEGDSTEKVGVCRVKRKGEAWYEQRFSLEDAKRASLLGKPGPWTQYTRRMLQLRARGFALRDKFSDALKGMIAAEEALDIETVQATMKETMLLSLKDKLKAQIENNTITTTNEHEEMAQGGDSGNAMPEHLPHEGHTLIHPEPSLDSIMGSYRSRFSQANTVHDLSEEGNAMEADERLSLENKKVLRDEFRKRIVGLWKMAGLGKRKA